MKGLTSEHSLSVGVLTVAAPLEATLCSKHWSQKPACIVWCGSEKQHTNKILKLSFAVADFTLMIVWKLCICCLVFRCWVPSLSVCLALASPVLPSVENEWCNEMQQPNILTWGNVNIIAFRSSTLESRLISTPPNKDKVPGTGG